MSTIIAPSLLASDFANLQRDIELVNSSDADWFHLDIMDGQFVPNISFGIPVCEAIARHATKPLDIHLMIQRPEHFLQKLAGLGAGYITVHYEACPHLHRVVQQIKELGCRAGVALNPHTPVSLLTPILADLDLVCLMSVNPGFGGQKFIGGSFNKLRDLRQMIAEEGSHTLIEIDGGVNIELAPELIRAGADVLVAGSFVFGSSNPSETIKDLKCIMT